MFMQSRCACFWEMMTIYHKTIGRDWNNKSLPFRMLSIGSELSRIMHVAKSDSRIKCLERAFELIDITVQDQSLGPKRKELLRLREMLGEMYSGHQDSGNLQQFYEYCFAFSKLKPLFD